MAHAYDRNLLFGAIALQTQSVTKDQLFTAIQAWSYGQQVSLGEHLVRAGALQADQCASLNMLVEANIALQKPVKPAAEPSRTGTKDSVNNEQRLDEEVGDPDQTTAHASKRGETTQTQYSKKSNRSSDQTTDESRSAGRFGDIRFHDRGGLGIVSSAKDLELLREVAFKEIRPDFADIDEIRERFIREAKITGILEHPGIVPIYGLGVFEDGRPYYAMRFIKGKSFDEVIRKFHGDCQDPKKPLSPGESNLRLRRLLQRFIQICEAVEFAHGRGVLHRDLKPKNVMIGSHGETLVVDWGLACLIDDVPAMQADPSTTIGFSQVQYAPLNKKEIGSSDLTEAGTPLGTLRYMSPEQARGQWELVKAASDIFSLGAILYEILTDRSPYAHANDKASAIKAAQECGYPVPRELNPKISKAIEAICLKALAHDPASRYSSAKALANDVESYLADEPVTARRDTAWERTGRILRRHRSATMIGALALLVVTTGTTIATIIVNAAKNSESLALAKERQALEQETVAKNKVSESLQRERYLKKELIAQYAEDTFKSGIIEMQKSDYWKSLNTLFQASLIAEKDSDLYSIIDRVLSDKSRLMRQRYTLDEPVEILQYSEDGLYLAAAMEKTVKIWNTRTGEQVGKDLKLTNHVNAIAISPNGRRLVVAVDLNNYADNQDNVFFWDINRSIFEEENIALEYAANCLAFSPDGSLLALGSQGHAFLYNTKTKLSPAKLTQIQHPQMIRPSWISDVTPQVKFNNDGTYLLTSDKEGTVCVWNTSSDTTPRLPAVLKTVCKKVDWEPSGNTLLTVDSFSTTQRWDKHTGMPKGEPISHPGALLQNSAPNVNELGASTVESNVCMAISPDGISHASTLGNRLSVVNSETGDIVFQELDSVIVSLNYTRDATRIVLLSQNNQIHLYDTVTKTMYENVMTLPNLKIYMVSPDGTEIASAYSDNHVIVWDLVHDQLARYERGIDKRDRNNPVKVELWTENSMHLVTKCEDDNTTVVWNATNGKQIEKFNASSIWSVELSSDGKAIALAKGDSTIVWDVFGKKELGPPIQHEEYVSNLAFCPKAENILICNVGGSLKYYNIRTGEKKWERQLKIPYHGWHIIASTFSPDGKTIVLGDEAEKVFLIDAVDGQILKSHIDLSTQIIASETIKKFYALLSLEARIEARKPKLDRGYDNRFSLRFAFSPKNHIFASHGSHRQLRFWDTSSGKPFGPTINTGDDVKSMQFNPDGSLLMTIDKQGYSRTWDVYSGAQIGQKKFFRSPDQLISYKPGADRLDPGMFRATETQLFQIYPVLPTDEITYFELLLGHKQYRGEYVALTPIEFQQRRQILKDDQKYQSALSAYEAKRMTDYHEYWLQAAKFNNHWFAISFHLRALLKYDPKNNEYAEELARAEQNRNKNTNMDLQLPAVIQQWLERGTSRNERPNTTFPISEPDPIKKSQLQPKQDNGKPLAAARKKAQSEIAKALADRTQKPIIWKQAAEKQGQVVTVVGIVQQAFLSKSKELVILNFGTERIGEFCLVVPVALLTLEQQKAPLDYLQKEYVGKTVKAVGLVELYEHTDTPQFTLDALEQISVEPLSDKLKIRFTPTSRVLKAGENSRFVVEIENTAVEEQELELTLEFSTVLPPHAVTPHYYEPKYQLSFDKKQRSISLKNLKIPARSKLEPSFEVETYPFVKPNEPLIPAFIRAYGFTRDANICQELKIEFPKVQGSAVQMEISKSEVGQQIKVGKQYRYSILVNNIGIAPDKNVQLTVKLPDQVQIVPNGINLPAQVNGQVITFQSNDEIKPTDRPSKFIIDVTATQAGNGVFEATLSSQGLAQPQTMRDEVHFYSN